MKRRQSISSPGSIPHHPNLVYPISSSELDDENSNGYITIGKGVNWPARPVDKSKLNWL